LIVDVTKYPFSRNPEGSALMFIETRREKGENKTLALDSRPNFDIASLSVIELKSNVRATHGVILMTINLSADLMQRIQLHIQGGTANSAEEVLRKALDVLDTRSREILAKQSQEDLAAISASLEDLDRGERGRPAMESLADVRKQMGISSPS